MQSPCHLVLNIFNVRQRMNYQHHEPPPQQIHLHGFFVSEDSLCRDYQDALRTSGASDTLQRSPGIGEQCGSLDTMLFNQRRVSLKDLVWYTMAPHMWSFVSWSSPCSQRLNERGSVCTRYRVNEVPVPVGSIIHQLLQCMVLNNWYSWITSEWSLWEFCKN